MFSEVHYFIIKASSGLEEFMVHCAVLLHSVCVSPSLWWERGFINTIAFSHQTQAFHWMCGWTEWKGYLYRSSTYSTLNQLQLDVSHQGIRANSAFTVTSHERDPRSMKLFSLLPKANDACPGSLGRLVGVRIPLLNRYHDPHGCLC